MIGTRMHTTVLPEAVTISRGRSALLAVLVTNLSDVIDAYTVEVLGVDPEWVSVATPRVSLFPGESVQIDLEITPSPDTPAAQRPLIISVGSENDVGTFQLLDVALTIEPVAVTQVSVDPPVITAGKSAEFGLIVTNTGNSPAQVRPFGVDPEELADFSIEPSHLIVPNGGSAVVRVEAKGGRSWFGTPRPRTFSLGVDAETRLEVPATFVQRPRIPRWLISLAGLLAAATVFAFVLSHAFDRVVEEASVGDDVLDEALRSGQAGGAVVPANPGSVTGRLTTSTNSAIASAGAGLRPSGQIDTGASTDVCDAGSASIGVAAVQLTLFVEGAPDEPYATAATDDRGCFTIANLGEGTYKMLMSGAGYPDVWFVEGGPGASNPADATPIEVALGDPEPLEEVQIGGIPVTVAGSVAGDAAGATITLIRPGVVDPETPAVVAQVTVGADGSFELPDIPSPADLEMIVEKPGFATTTRKVTLQPGTELGDISIQLTPADGQVSGSVFGPDGPLGGVAISATDGQYTIETVSYTEGAVGTFTLRNLSTPGRYTVTAEVDGFVPETQTVVLAANQTLVTLAPMVLTPATGAIEGSVRLESAATGETVPSGEVTITLTGGPDLEQTIRSFSGDGPEAGTYRFDRLPSPGAYTLTFAGGGSIPQVRVVELRSGAGGSTALIAPVELRLEQRRVEGRVVELLDGEIEGVAGASVTLSDGAETRTLLSANDPIGEFAFDGIAPGAYTLRAERAGAFATVVPVTVEPGVPIAPVELRLAEQASLSGTVVTGGSCDIVVRLFPFGQFDSEPVDSVVPINGSYRFLAVDAPVGYLVAVYTPSATEPLATTSVASTPSAEQLVPTIDVSAACASLGS